MHVALLRADDEEMVRLLVEVEAASAGEGTEGGVVVRVLSSGFVTSLSSITSWYASSDLDMVHSVTRPSEETE